MDSVRGRFSTVYMFMSMWAVKPRSGYNHTSNLIVIKVLIDTAMLENVILKVIVSVYLFRHQPCDCESPLTCMVDTF